MGVAQRAYTYEDVSGAYNRSAVRAQAEQAEYFSVVLAYPQRYEDAAAIASRFDESHAVLLNLEAATKDAARRLIDFLSGVAYAADGHMRQIAKNAYLLLPAGVEMVDEHLSADDLDDLF